MYLQQISRRVLGPTLLALALTFGGGSALAAQQSADSTRATTVSPAPDSAAAATPWRNYVPADTAPARRNAPVVEGGGTTIYISTLALVLAVIIIVLLIR